MWSGATHGQVSCQNLPGPALTDRHKADGEDSHKHQLFFVLSFQGHWALPSPKWPPSQSP